MTTYRIRCFFLSCFLLGSLALHAQKTAADQSVVDTRPFGLLPNRNWLPNRIYPSRIGWGIYVNTSNCDNDWFRRPPNYFTFSIATTAKFTIAKKFCSPSLIHGLPNNANNFRSENALKQLLATTAMPQAFFCKLELENDKASRVNCRFRLGSVDYVDALERKRPTY